jgi:hypothetical protein
VFENTNITPPKLSTHDRVVNHIAQSFQGTYTVLSNIGTPKHYISSIFPDLIMQDKADNKTRFIIEVKENGGVALCIQAWKSQPSIPATLYIVVPKDLLSEAKKVAQIVGLSARFGSYTVTNDEIKVDFE